MTDHDGSRSHDRLPFRTAGRPDDAAYPSEMLDAADDADDSVPIRDRWLIAASLAVILHLVLSGFVHLPRRHRDRALPHPRVAVFLHVVHVRPTPRPTPPVRRVPPVPKVAVRHASRPAGAGSRSILRSTHHATARASRPLARPKEIAKATPRPALPTPLFMGLAARDAHTRGQGEDVGGTATAGGGTAGTAANGGARGATGGGSGGGETPCGSPILGNFGQIKTFGGLEHVSIRASIRFSNGRESRTEEFPYQFVYHGDAESPFSRQHRDDPSFPTLVQLPPPGFDRSLLPPVVRAIVENTGPDGTTRFAPCPADMEP